MHLSRASDALVAHSLTCDVASTYWTEVLGSDVHRPTYLGALGGSGPVVVVVIM